MSRHEAQEGGSGIVIPEPPRPIGFYLPGVRVGSLIYLSGQTPQIDGKTVVRGPVGAETTVADAAHGARIACINSLSQAQALIGDLERVRRVVRVTGYVAAVDDFSAHPAVINGASELLIEYFGEARGRHARSAIGVKNLPDNAAVELDLILEIKPD